MKFRVLLLSLFVVAVGLAVAPIAAPQSKATSSTTVTVTMKEFKFILSKKSVPHVQAGSGTWSTTGADKQEQLALTYSWRGTLRFAVPTYALAEPARARFTARSIATLTAAWTGELNGTAATVGRYRCRYTGKNVAGRVTAALSNGRKRATLRLVLHANGRHGFFPPKRRGASV